MIGENFFATRHAKPERYKTDIDPASKEYPDLTERGVEQAQEKARGEISDLINSAPENAVILIGATSDQPRTKQTAEIYGDELAKIQKDTHDENILVLTKKDIEAMADSQDNNTNKPGFAIGETVKVVKNIESIIKDNAEKKVVVDYPLMVKQLAYKYNNRWTDQNGNKTEYFSEILKKYNNNHEEAGKDWIANQGKLELPGGHIIHGPNPAQVGAEYLEGVRRLFDFAKKYIGERPLIVGEIGHQWDLDALVTYLSNNGKVDEESFIKATGGEIAGETEMTQFSLSNKEVKLKYRDREFTISQEKN